MTPEEFQKALAELLRMSDDEQASWLEANGAQLTSDQLQEIVDASGLPGRTRQTADGIRRDVRRRENFDAAGRRRQVIIDRNAEAAARSQFDLNEDGEATDEEVTSAAEAGSEVAASLLGFEDLEPETLDLLAQTFGRIPSDGEIEQLLTQINERAATNFGRTFEDINEAVTFASEQQLLGSLAGPEAEPAFLPTKTMQLASGEQITLGVDQLELATRTLEITEGQLASLATIADLYGLRRADGSGIAWQPLAAILRATGQGVTGETADVRQDLLSKAREIYAKMRKVENAADAEFGGAGGRSAVLSRLRRRYQEALADWNAAAPGTTGSAGPGAVNAPSVLAARYKNGLEKYGGNEAMAFLHSVDEGLAARISAAGGVEGGQVSWQDARLAGQYVSAAFPGAADTDDLVASLVGLGYGEAAGSGTIASLLQLLQAQAGFGGGAGGGRTRIMPDRVQVKQAARDFYQQLFLAEPSDDQLESFTSQIMSQVSSAPLDENVDVNARIRDIAESMPEYQELYGSKPGSLTDAEYQGMMRAGQESMLGAELAGNQSAKLGMRGGQYQTAVGAAAGTSEAWSNSTFLGRLARAANVVSQNT